MLIFNYIKRNQVPKTSLTKMVKYIYRRLLVLINKRKINGNVKRSQVQKFKELTLLKCHTNKSTINIQCDFFKFN